MMTKLLNVEHTTCLLQIRSAALKTAKPRMPIINTENREMEHSGIREDALVTACTCFLDNLLSFT